MQRAKTKSAARKKGSSRNKSKWRAAAPGGFVSAKRIADREKRRTARPKATLSAKNEAKQRHSNRNR
jgi:hypothetical protein